MVIFNDENVEDIYVFLQIRDQERVYVPFCSIFFGETKNSTFITLASIIVSNTVHVDVSIPV